MRRIIIIVLVVCLLETSVFAQKQAQSPQSNNGAKEINVGAPSLVYVSVPPLTYFLTFFLDALGQDTVQVKSIVGEGKNAEKYEPTFRQLRSIESADVWFVIGLPFEKKLIQTLAKKAPNVKILPLGATVVGIEDMHEHEEESYVAEANTEKNHEIGTDILSDTYSDSDSYISPYTEGINPHIWMSYQNGRIIAKDMYWALRRLYPQRSEKLEKAYKTIEAKILEQENMAKHKLLSFKGEGFIIYHPVLDYFARDFGFVQIAIQDEGQEGSIKHIAEIHKFAQDERINVILIQEGFPNRSAEKLSKEIGAETVSITPLGMDWAQNLMEVTNILEKSFIRKYNAPIQ